MTRQIKVKRKTKNELDRLKAKARLQGKKISHSQIIDDLLRRKK